MSQPDIDPEYTETEWKLFCQVIFVQQNTSSLHKVQSMLLSCGDNIFAFPNI